MVDYNNDVTISTPPGEILKIAILERRAYLINALEKHRSLEAKRGSSTAQDIYVVSAALVGLFLELQAALENDDSVKIDGKSVEFKDLERRVFKQEHTFDEAVRIFNGLNSWLYKKNLTKFDTRAATRGDDVEGVNRSHGL